MKLSFSDGGQPVTRMDQATGTTQLPWNTRDEGFSGEQKSYDKGQ